MNTGSCPCLYTAPCHERCTCVTSVSSSGCRRCCSYGSLEQREVMAAHLADIIDQAHSPAVDDDDEEENGWGFIALDDGRLYIRQSDIGGLRWIRDEHYDDQTGMRSHSWHLQLFVEDVGPVHVYGDDVASVMEVLGLPTSPPER